MNNLVEEEIRENIQIYIKENTLSLRDFSTLVDIPISTLSRILNNKQKINLNHLNKLNKVISVKKDKDEEFFTEGITELLKSTNYSSKDGLSYEISKEFNKCKEFSSTKDGSRMIRSEFPQKIDSIKGVGPFVDSFKKLYNEYIKEVPFSAKAILIGAVLIYFITPIDAIPDYLFGIGYIDDMLILQLGLSLLNKKQQEN